MKIKKCDICGSLDHVYRHGMRGSLHDFCYSCSMLMNQLYFCDHLSDEVKVKIVDLIVKNKDMKYYYDVMNTDEKF